MRRVVGVDAGGEPVDHHVVDVLLDDAALFVVRRQRVPVGDEVEALELGLQAHPVLQRAVVVAEMQRAGRAHAREDALAALGAGSGGGGRGRLGGLAHRWAARRRKGAIVDLRPQRADTLRPLMKNIVILISGRGSNMEAIVRACGRGGVAGADRGGDQQSRRRRRPGASRRRTASPPRSSTTRAFASREAFDARLAEAIDAFRPDVVALAGFMRILDAGLRAALRRPAGQHPSVAAADVSRPAHAPARHRGRLQGGRRQRPLRDRRPRPRADHRPGDRAGAGRRHRAVAGGARARAGAPCSIRGRSAGWSRARSSGAPASSGTSPASRSCSSPWRHRLLPQDADRRRRRQALRRSWPRR